jgi:hypothetical protein
MHERDSQHSGSHRAPTQVEADSCCASSEREDPGPSIPAFAAVTSLADLGSVVLPAMVPALVLTDDWRTSSPVPSRPVPRHLLLSVFLV